MFTYLSRFSFATLQTEKRMLQCFTLILSHTVHSTVLDVLYSIKPAQNWTIHIQCKTAWAAQFSIYMHCLWFQIRAKV